MRSVVGSGLRPILPASIFIMDRNESTKMFTEQNCKDIGICLGMSEPESLVFYHHYNAQNWLFGNSQKITNLKSAMWRWKNNGYKEKNSKKAKLFPIRGKFCAELRNGRRCGMPAVYKSSGSYDNYYCKDCMPNEVKEQYE